jgi:hypothetical protein
MSERFIPINITKAQIVAIYLQFKPERLEYRAEVALFSEIGGQERKVTSINVGNDAWDEKQRADLSLETIDLASRLREEVEVAVVRFMNSKQNVLEHKG